MRRHRIAVFFCSVLLSFCVANAALGAGDGSSLTNAFNSIGGTGTSTKAGAYQSQVRNTYTAGSGTIRFGNDTAIRGYGINVTPPDVNVGCEGIDWHLGGISWVNSAKIEQMLQGLIQGAVMYTIKLAINALCEDCANELDSVMQAIRQLSGKAMDTCQMGMRLAQASFDKAGMGQCKNLLANTGIYDSREQARSDCDDDDYLVSLNDQGWYSTFSDQVSSFNETCTNGIMSCIGSFASGGEGGEDELGQTDEQKDNAGTLGIGNPAWQKMKARGLVLDTKAMAAIERDHGPETMRQRASLGIAMGELIMSMLSFPVVAENGKSYPVEPTIGDGAGSMRTVLGIMMCGESYFSGSYNAPDGSPLSQNAKRIISEKCSQIFGDTGEDGPFAKVDRSSVAIRTCYPSHDGGPADKYIDPFDKESELWPYFSKCVYSEGSTDVATVPSTNVADWMERPYVKTTLGKGTLMLTIGMMDGIISKIHDSSPSNPSTAFDDKEIAFIESAPFPLYKVLNHAAIFPEMRYTILESYGEIIALMISREFMLNYIRGAGAFGNPKGMSVDSETSRQLSEALNLAMANITLGITNSLDAMSENMERASTIEQSILRTDRRLRDTIFARGLMGNERFTMDVSKRENTANNN